MVLKKVAALALSGVLAVMGGVLCFLGWRLVISGYSQFIGIGIGLFLLAAVTFWYLAHELYLAWNVEKLTSAALEQDTSSDGRQQVAGQDKLLTGQKVTGMEDFEELRQQVQRSPDDSLAWLNLGYAYAAVGDKKNGRKAFVRAIKIHRTGH